MDLEGSDHSSKIHNKVRLQQNVVYSIIYTLSCYIISVYIFSTSGSGVLESIPKVFLASMLIFPLFLLLMRGIDIIIPYKFVNSFVNTKLLKKISCLLYNKHLCIEVYQKHFIEDSESTTNL